MTCSAHYLIHSRPLHRARRPPLHCSSLSHFGSRPFHSRRCEFDVFTTVVVNPMGKTTAGEKGKRRCEWMEWRGTVPSMTLNCSHGLRSLSALPKPSFQPAESTCFFPAQHGVRRLHLQEFVRQRCVVTRHVHVPGGLSVHDEGNDGVSSICDGDDGGCSQTGTSSLSAPDTSVTGKFFQFLQQNPRQGAPRR